MFVAPAPKDSALAAAPYRLQTGAAGGHGARLLRLIAAKPIIESLSRLRLAPLRAWGLLAAPKAPRVLRCAVSHGGASVAACRRCGLRAIEVAMLLIPVLA